MSTGIREYQRQGKRPRTQAGRTSRPGKPQTPRETMIAWRFRLVLTLLMLVAAAIAAKLFYIQVIDADNLAKKARQSRNQALTLYNRGRILDRNGMILAQDTLLYDLFAHRKYYWGAKPQEIAAALAPALQAEPDKLADKLSEPYDTVGVKKNLTREEVEAISEIRMPRLALDPKTQEPLLDDAGRPIVKKIPLPGLDFAKKTVRNYPQGNLAAHVLGYVNDGANISSGVEATAAHILKKKPVELGHAILDGRGNLIDPGKIDPKSIVATPKAKDVRLTIDARLQYVAERELAIGLEKSKASRGTVIMLDPRSGEILAFAVQPTYQPDQFYKAEPSALKNWAITDVYPPGSTFKILTVAAGLESGAIDRNVRIHDTGKMKVGGWTIQNYDYGKHGAPGSIDLIYLLQHSSNIASAKIAMMIPKIRHHQILKTIGIGSKTGIDLPGESAGILLPPKQWDVSTHATIGYGYGMASTPLQMAAAVASLANGGVWVTPHVSKNAKVQRRRVFSEKTAATVTELLAESIRTAKTSTVRIEGIDVAGKTGTSRKPRENGRGYDANLFTSFVGYFPAQKPEVLIMVVVDSPQMAEAWGSTVAGPIFRSVAKETISYLGLNTVKMGSGGSKHADGQPQAAVPAPATPSVTVNR